MSKNTLKNIFHTINHVALSETGLTEVEVLRTGIVQDRGLKITKKMLQDFVDHHQEDVYGSELQVNFNHNREGEAAGWIKELKVKGEQLFAVVEWTKLGAEKIKDKLYKFVSAEFADVPNHKTGKVVDNVFIGLALTNVPALKGQSPIALSEDIELNNQPNSMFKSYIEKLSEREYVSKEDKEMARQLFEELSEEEQAEHKEAVEEVEAKDEAPAEDEKGGEEGGDEEEKPEGEKEDEADEKEDEEEKEGGEELSEKLNATTTELAETKAEVAKLQEQLTKKELSEQFDNELLVNEARPVGLLAKSKDKAVEFMTGLSPEDRKVFVELLSEATAVDLSVHGSTNVESINLSEEGMADKVTELAETLMAEDKELSIGDAQKMAIKQLSNK